VGNYQGLADGVGYIKALEQRIADLAAQVGKQRVLFAEVTTEETTTNISYAALATAGPSITIPAAGDYIVEIGFGGMGSAIGIGVAMSYDIGGTGAVDADRVYFETQVASQRLPHASRARQKTLVAVTLTAKYKVTSGTGTFRDRWMRVTRL